MKILFVCHGNICRSPMAEFIMKRLVNDAGLDDKIEICSRAISNEELDNPVYPPAKEELARRGLSCKGKYAVQLRRDDYDKYDMFVIMDEWNEMRIGGILGRDDEALYFGQPCHVINAIDFLSRQVYIGNRIGLGL